jgi:hypothetical protein
MLTVAEKKYVDELRAKAGDEGSIGSLLRIVLRLESRCQTWQSDYSLLWDHMKENGGLCEPEQDYSVGIELCGICYPDGLPGCDDDVI